MPHRLTPRTINTEAELRSLIGEPTPLVCAKVHTQLTPLTRRFIALSPFFCLATADKQGACDVSPRGDPSGFVQILDDHTLLLPERPGNRIADSLRNILQNPQAGLLFFIPGVDDTLSRSVLPTNGEILRSISGETFDAEEYDRARAERYFRREGFY